MAKPLQLHRSDDAAVLNRSIFRPHFEDPQLEAAWMVHRLDTFRRVNRRAAWFLLFCSVLLFAVDVALVGSTPAVLVSRGVFFILTLALVVALNRVQDTKQGDWLLLGASSILGTFVWFQIFMQLPQELLSSYWLVTAALMVTICFVLLEMVLLARLAVVALMLLITLSAPFVLGLGLGETLLGLMHVVLVADVGWVAAWQVEVARRSAFVNQLGVERERERTVDLLRNILPEPIADRLLNDPGTIAERYDSVSVLFADIVGFTPWASTCEADQVVEVLDTIFSSFDQLCDAYEVEKIKTIGDAYMAAGGVPSGGGGATESVVQLALSMLDEVDKMPVQEGTSLQLRIGIHQGPVVAGVIGRRKFIYDLWGDTVNTAARMESHGVPGRVQITQAVADQLGEDFVIEPRGVIEVKGKGPMKAYLVDSTARPDG